MKRFIPGWLFSHWILLAWAIFAGIVGWWSNRPIPLALSYNELLPSVSFAPYRRGQSPLTRVYPSPAQVEADLASLVGVTRGVRTYSSREGLDRVPVLARRYGLTVTQGAWLTIPRQLDGTPTANEAEIDALIRVANANPDTVKRVIVGNEVLLRGELTPNQLIDYIRRVKAAVSQPVSYADVWAFFLKYPEVVQELDVLTIHILPYWEDEPVSLEESARHLMAIYQRMAQTFPGKPILIGEVGWPTQGRSRGAAVASLENSARFLRTVATLAREQGFDYNWVEAFDQPWKSAQEGTVGAKWGVVDESRHPKFALHGPVEVNPHWPLQLAMAVGLGLLGGWWAIRRSSSSRREIIWLGGLAQLLAGLVVCQAGYVLAISHSSLGDAWAVLRILFHGLLAWALITPEGTSDPWKALGRVLLPVYSGAAVFATVMLLIDGRYRDIPTLEFLVPALGVVVYGLGSGLWQRRSLMETLAAENLFQGSQQKGEGGYNAHAGRLALALVSAALLAPLSEAVALSRGQDFLLIHPHWEERWPLLLQALTANQQMLNWSLMLLLLALPWLAQWQKNLRRLPRC